MAASDPTALAQAIIARDRSALARALNLLDDSRPTARADASALLGELARLCTAASSRLVGMTGPPGVGKSSLTAALIRHWRSEGLNVGVLAVDPSSPISGGALLGDRLRMQVAEDDEGVFIRSLSSRGEFGGVSEQVLPMSLVMMAACDVVIIETVGVGQREVDIASLCDTTCFVAQPGSGDSIQFIKAGVMEIPHIVIVNKADLGDLASRTLSELESAIHRDHPDGDWEVRLLATSATRGTGVAELAQSIEERHTALVQAGSLEQRRRGYQAQWLLSRVAREFGQYGLERLGGAAAVQAQLHNASPDLYTAYQVLRERILQDNR